MLDDSAKTGSIDEAHQVALEIIKTGRYRVVAETPNYFLQKL
jgi:hypothetical protein